jgi:peptide/nickel transport system permease protein
VALGIYAVKRASYFFLLLFGVSVIVFGSMRLVPGDPIVRLAGPFATEKQRAQVRQSYGLDEPVVVQYMKWLGKAASGDLGISMQLNMSVLPLLVEKTKNTLLLVAGSMLIAILGGWSLGINAGLRPGSWLDRSALMIALTGMSLPAFWFGMVLVILFAINTKLFPASGITSQHGVDGGLVDVLRHLVLPSLATAVLPAGMLIRACRSAIVDVARQPFISSLYARGLPRRVIHRHILKNALPTILNATGMQAGFLLTAAIFSEVVFNWPGLGLQIFTAVVAQDYTVVQGAVLFVCILFLLFNILIDVVRPIFDPRISLQ